MRYVVLGVNIDTSPSEVEVERLIWIQKPGHAPGLLPFLLERRTDCPSSQISQKTSEGTRPPGVVIGGGLCVYRDVPYATRGKPSFGLAFHRLTSHNLFWVTY